MGKLAKEYLNRLRNRTFKEILEDEISREIFKSFIQNGHVSPSDSMLLLRRYTLCGKITANMTLIENSDLLEELISLTPSFLWEERIRDMAGKASEKDNLKYALKNLRAETYLEIMCHTDYNRFMQELSGKAKFIKKLLKSM